jgi:hypothetical protein
MEHLPPGAVMDEFYLESLGLTYVIKKVEKTPTGDMCVCDIHGKKVRRNVRIPSMSFNYRV